MSETEKQAEPVWRTVNIEPIEDLHAICETMDEFGIGNPENYAALEVAKACAANRHAWTGGPITPPLTLSPAEWSRRVASLLAAARAVVECHDQGWTVGAGNIDMLRTAIDAMNEA